MNIRRVLLIYKNDQGSVLPVYASGIEEGGEVNLIGDAPAIDGYTLFDKCWDDHAGFLGIEVVTDISRLQNGDLVMSKTLVRVPAEWAIDQIATRKRVE